MHSNYYYYCYGKFGYSITWILKIIMEIEILIILTTIIIITNYSKYLVNYYKKEKKFDAV